MFGFVRPAACRSSAPRSVTDGCPCPPLPRRAKNRNKIQLSSHRKQEISGNGWNAFHRLRLLLPPLRRSPSLDEGGLGAARALSKSLIQPRVQGRNPGCFNGGYGVPRGFKGEKSKFPPNPLGLAERVPRIARRLCNRSPVLPPQRPPSSREGDRPQAVEGVLPPPVKGVYALNPHSILTAYSGCNSFAPKPSIFQPTVEIWSSGSAVPALPAGLTITRGFAPLRLVTP